MNPRLDKRFWTSTRGHIILLLRSADRTVNELAEALALTDNAVRAHLVALERDGLVRASGKRPGTRKPNTSKTYADGETVTYDAYDTTNSPMLDLLYASGSRTSRSRSSGAT